MLALLPSSSSLYRLILTTIEKRTYNFRVIKSRMYMTVSNVLSILLFERTIDEFRTTVINIIIYEEQNVIVCNNFTL